MPYGTNPSHGKDAEARMERCVSEVMSKGHSKQSAIRICKASLKRSKKRHGSR